jgi:hypothetical protein
MALRRLYASLEGRSKSAEGLDYGAFADCFTLPGWLSDDYRRRYGRRRCSLLQTLITTAGSPSMSSSLSSVSSSRPTGTFSFLDEESLINFLYQLCDMNGDGVIDPQDLALFACYSPHLPPSWQIYRTSWC